MYSDKSRRPEKSNQLPCVVDSGCSRVTCEPWILCGPVCEDEHMSVCPDLLNSTNQAIVIDGPEFTDIRDYRDTPIGLPNKTAIRGPSWPDNGPIPADPKSYSWNR
jgi:hypothetical protein